MTVARNYASTKSVEIDGIVFHLGWIPRGVHRRLVFEAQEVNRQAIRRSLLRLRREHAEDGLPDPTEAEVNHLRAQDPDFADAMERMQREMVGWGVCKHEGFKDETGAELPFEAQERDYLGQKFLGAGDRMVLTYAEAGLLSRLYVEVSLRNALTHDAKKNSEPPSPSEPITGGGTATTA